MLRHVALFAAALTLSLAGNAAASEMTSGGPLAEAPASGPLNTITLNPLAMLLGSFSLEYERAVSPGMSWFVGPRYAFARTSDAGVETTVHGVGVVGGLRLFLTGVAPKGLFLSPNASVGYASGKDNLGGEASAISYSLGLLGGYTWIFADVFDLSIGLGAQYASPEAKADNGRKLGYSGFGPDLRLSLGYAF